MAAAVGRGIRTGNTGLGITGTPGVAGASAPGLGLACAGRRGGAAGSSGGGLAGAAGFSLVESAGGFQSSSKMLDAVTRHDDAANMPASASPKAPAG